MSIPQRKTIDEHRDYLYQIVRLKLFFMHYWLEHHPAEEPMKVLRSRVDIYRKTDANTEGLNPVQLQWESPAWQALEQPLLTCYRRNISDRARFEEEGFAILKESLDARCERDFLDTSALKPYQCGSLRYNIYDGPRPRIGFHIANAVSPRSIFDNPLYLPACFMTLMEQVEALYDAVEIATGTWLNSNPKWLALFPAEWHDNMDSPTGDITWSYGVWGQFISARGTFNKRYGDYLRNNGRFTFLPRNSFCSISAMRRHLTAIMKQHL